MCVAVGIGKLKLAAAAAAAGWVGGRKRGTRMADKGWANDRTTSEHFACSAWPKNDDVHPWAMYRWRQAPRCEARPVVPLGASRRAMQVGGLRVRAEYCTEYSRYGTCVRVRVCACACVSMAGWLADEQPVSQSINQSISHSVIIHSIRQGPHEAR